MISIDDFFPCYKKKRAISTETVKLKLIKRAYSHGAGAIFIYPSLGLMNSSEMPSLDLLIRCVYKMTLSLSFRLHLQNCKCCACFTNRIRHILYIGYKHVCLSISFIVKCIILQSLLMKRLRECCKE